MSYEKFAIVSAVVVATMVAAMPHRHPRTVELADAVNKTVCPIEIDVDIDPNRVPKRIKVLRCAADPAARCTEQGIPRRDCCAHHRAHHVMECVEIVDTVRVHYPAGAAPHDAQLYRVPVGCTCLVERTGRAGQAT